MLVSEQDLRRLVGHRLPGGQALVEPYVDWLVRDVVGAPPPPGDGTAHPTVAFLAAQGGVGLELEDLFALFGASSADGPVLGEWAVVFTEPLRVGVAYTVTCVVEAVVRRHGERSGLFDVVTVRIEMTAPDGRVHVTVRPSYVFPRRSA